MNSYKKFSKSDYNKHDKKAKTTARKFLSSRGYKVVDIKENMNYDLIVEVNDKKIAVEAEHKTTWKGETWPAWFATVDVPHRKAKNISKLYLLFNDDYTYVGVAKMQDVRSAKTYTKDTCYTTNERFFAVDPDKFQFYKV